MAIAKTTTNEPRPPVATPGDNRSADDVDGNKSAAGAANKARGPNEPEATTGQGEAKKPSR